MSDDATVLKFEDDQQVCFAPDLSAEVNGQLQSAVRAARQDDEKAIGFLQQAKAADRNRYEADIALYKLLCYRGRFQEALAQVESTIDEVVKQLQLPPNPFAISAESLQAENPDSPGRALLYSFKARAFIALRANRPSLAEESFALLARLDPNDLTGWSVVQAIAEGMHDE